MLRHGPLLAICYYRKVILNFYFSENVTDDYDDDDNSVTIDDSLERFSILQFDDENINNCFFFLTQAATTDNSRLKKYLITCRKYAHLTLMTRKSQDEQ